MMCFWLGQVQWTVCKQLQEQVECNQTLVIQQLHLLHQAATIADWFPMISPTLQEIHCMCITMLAELARQQEMLNRIQANLVATSRNKTSRHSVPTFSGMEGHGIQVLV